MSLGRLSNAPMATDIRQNLDAVRKRLSEARKGALDKLKALEAELGPDKSRQAEQREKLAIEIQRITAVVGMIKDEEGDAYGALLDERELFQDQQRKEWQKAQTDWEAARRSDGKWHLGIAAVMALIAVGTGYAVAMQAHYAAQALTLQKDIISLQRQQPQAPPPAAPTTIVCSTPPAPSLAMPPALPNKAPRK